MRRRSSLAVFAALVLLSLPGGPAGSQPARTVDPALYGGLRWRSIGPFRGGRVNGVSGVPGQPDTFYFGSVGGGVWKTTNAGRTWQPIFDSQPIASIGAVAVAPVRPEHRLRRHRRGRHAVADLATATGCTSRPTPARRGRTSGSTTRARSAASSSIRRTPNVVFVAALGHVYGANPDRGVYRSRDGGATWQKVLFKSNDIGAIDLAFDPANPQTIYASLWNTRRPPWSIYPPSYGPGSGLYKSTDGGANWQPLTRRACRPTASAASASPSRRANRAASTRSSTRKDGGLYRSDDARRDVAQVVERRRASGDAAGTSARSPSIRRTPISSTSPNTGVYRVARRRPDASASRSRDRPAATTITSCGSLRTIRTA